MNALLVVLGNCIVLLISLLILEMGTRWFAPDWLRWRMEQLSHLQEANSEIGTDLDWKIELQGNQFIRFTPNTSFDVIHPEYQYRMHIDEYGCRRTVPTHTTMPLIPFLGDSFTLGLGVRDEDTYISHLQYYFVQRFINLGITGSALPQQISLIKLRHEALGHPHLYVFAFFFGNDFSDMMTFDDNTTTSQGTILDNQYGLNENQDTLSQWNYWLLNSQFRHSYLVQYTRQMAGRWMYSRYSSRHMDPVFMLMDTRNHAYHIRAMTLLERYLDQLVVLSKNKHFDILFLAIPDKYQSVSPALKAAYYGIPIEQLDQNLPNRLLRDALAERGIPLIDVTYMFQKRLNPDALYYKYDNHWTPEGHRFFANQIRDELEEFIKRRNLVEQN